MSLNPDDPDTLSHRAESCLRQGELEQATGHYRRLVELCPQSAKAHTSLALLEERAGNLQAAADSLRRALAIEPDSPRVCCQLAMVLRQLEALPEALSLCKRAAALDPGRLETYNDLGVVLTDMNSLTAATEAFARSLALKPDSAATTVALGYFFVKCGDLAAAAESFRCAIKLDPGTYLAHLRLGAVLSQLGDRAEALASFERAQTLDPDSSDAIAFMGQLHLAEGNFALGWTEYEHRESARRARRPFTQPQWKGEPLDGARIFLHAEQGLGDTLQTVRYVPLVAARGGQVILGVQSRLRRLLAATAGAWQVIGEGETVPDFSWHCPLFSLPLAFATDLATIPAKVPYVHPDPAHVETWRQRLPGRSLRIGLVWEGNPKHPHERRRSIPLELLAPLTNLEGTTFYSLQMGPSTDQVELPGSSLHLIDLKNEQQDFADTAAIVANLDLVISIDTSVAHLAGSMGKPVWILLQNSPDWRWMLEREDSPWYPTARLFRQSTFGNWQDVVTRVGRAVRALIAETPVGTANGSLQR